MDELKIGLRIQVGRHKFWLTGYQIQKILDGLLYNALYPIMIHSGFITPYMSKILAWVARNRRRKIASLSQVEQLVHLLAYVTEPYQNKRFQIYTKLGIERNITAKIIRDFLQATSGYTVALVSNSPQSKQFCRDIEQRFNVTPNTLYNTIHQSETFLNMFIGFRDKLIASYSHLALVQMKQRKQAYTGTAVDKDDMLQDVNYGVMMAIDKYDYRKGALVSYIIMWVRYILQSHRSGHEYGTVFSMPISALRAGTLNNISMELDDVVLESLPEVESIEVEAEEEASNLLLRRAAQKADPKGYIRLQLGIEEVLTKTHLMMMKHHTELENSIL